MRKGLFAGRSPSGVILDVLHPHGSLCLWRPLRLCHSALSRGRHCGRGNHSASTEGMSPGLLLIHSFILYVCLCIALFAAVGLCRSMSVAARRSCESPCRSDCRHCDGWWTVSDGCIGHWRIGQQSHEIEQVSQHTLIHSSIQMEILQIATGLVSIAFPNWQ